MASTTHKVVSGDALSKIAEAYSTTVSTLLKLNPDIKDEDLIYVGQEIVVSGDAKKQTTNISSTPKITAFGLQSSTDRTVFATWAWDKANTENYEVKWKYGTGDGIGYIGTKTTSDEKQSIYTAPENATHVTFEVKPISTTYTKGTKEYNYWVANWSTKKTYYFKNNPPSTPPVPTVTIEDYTLTATLDNLSLNEDTADDKNTYVEFQIVKDDAKVFNSGRSNITTRHAEYSCTVDAGGEYKVRCRAVRGDLKSEWCDYSNNVGTAPSASKGIHDLRAKSGEIIIIKWYEVKNAKSYEVEFTQNKSRFDSSNETETRTVDAPINHMEIDGLETGVEWFFRVRAINDNGHSAWTEIKSVKLGEKPSAPTTWSSTSTVIAGEDLVFYWVHNSEDGSAPTYALLELDIGTEKQQLFIQNVIEDSEADQVYSQSFNTTSYAEGTKIKWRVKTMGLNLSDKPYNDATNESYSDWSIQRTVDVYGKPSASISIQDTDYNVVSELDSLPFNVRCSAEPNSQRVIGYHLSITANSRYETVDSMGNIKMVGKGEEVYSKFVNTATRPYTFKISAGDINLENNISYTATCTASMNSGLTASESTIFTVAWSSEEYWPNAEIGYFDDTCSVRINPYCEDEDGDIIDDLKMSVYRREFDGSFTEIGRNLKNSRGSAINDPHPSLDYARYRIVATSQSTGKVSYYDMPGYPIEEKAIIIQWDEQWSEFDVSGEDEAEEPSYAGSLLRLPYNIDVSEKHDMDVSLVEYIGRKHPVSYYGTQLGESASWNVEIEKSDKDTIYALRRLAVWTGDVYVREPSGSGYWANISVSFGQKHCELTIPVTLDITRVEGGK